MHGDPRRTRLEGLVARPRAPSAVQDGSDVDVGLFMGLFMGLFVGRLEGYSRCSLPLLTASLPDSVQYWTFLAAGRR
jgi:hypothetical protein